MNIYLQRHKEGKGTHLPIETFFIRAARVVGVWFTVASVDSCQVHLAEPHVTNRTVGVYPDVWWRFLPKVTRVKEREMPLNPQNYSAKASKSCVTKGF